MESRRLIIGLGFRRMVCVSSSRISSEPLKYFGNLKSIKDAKSLFTVVITNWIKEICCLISESKPGQLSFEAIRADCYHKRSGQAVRGPGQLSLEAVLSVCYYQGSWQAVQQSDVLQEVRVPVYR
jgi:hypothetical protein